MRFADLAVIAAYLVFITWFGARFKDQQKTSKIISWAAAARPGGPCASPSSPPKPAPSPSSARPRIAFAGNFGFLQMVLGYLLARIVICDLFLPQYFRGEMFTAYELMQRRFGPQIRQLHRRDISGACAPWPKASAYSPSPS